LLQALKRLSTATSTKRLIGLIMVGSLGVAHPMGVKLDT